MGKLDKLFSIGKKGGSIFMQASQNVYLNTEAEKKRKKEKGMFD